MSKKKLSSKEKNELQRSFENIFGKNSSSHRKSSKVLSGKVYFYGLILATLMLLLIFLPKIVAEHLVPIVWK